MSHFPIIPLSSSCAYNQPTNHSIVYRPLSQLYCLTITDIIRAMPLPQPPPQAHMVHPAYGSADKLIPGTSPPPSPPSTPPPNAAPFSPRLHPDLQRNEVLLNKARHAQATTPRRPPQPPAFLATLAFSVRFWLATLFLLLGAISTGASIGVLNAVEGYKPGVELWLVLSLVALLFGVVVLVGVVGVIKGRAKGGVNHRYPTKRNVC